MKIGFIGLGHMGNPMVRNLLKHGHALKIYDVVPELAKKLAAEGCELATSAADCAKGVEVVVTMLPSSPHVRSVYLSDYGVLKGAAPGTPLIDSSTIDPLTAREVAMDAKARRCPMVDAPVSGEVAKICNNLMLAIEMIATAEGMTLAAKLGMDPKVFAAIVNTSSGRCWSSDTYNPYPGVLENVPASRAYAGGFGSDLMLKDLTLVTDAAKVARHPVMLGAIAQQIYQKHSVDGNGAKDFSSVILQYMKA